MLLLCEGQVNLYHFYENVLAVNLFLLLSCGLLVVVQNNPVSAIFSFVLTAFFSYLFLVLIGAEFFALLVLIIYIGVITVLFLFVVILYNLRIVYLP